MIYNKKLIVIAAGTESYSFPSIGYGNFRKPVLCWFTKQSFKRTDLILPVSEKLIECNYTYYSVDFPKQGIKYFYPQLNSKVITIPYGYNSDEWIRKDIPKNPKGFVTIAGGSEKKSVFLRKGIDLILKSALLFPHYSFTVIGIRDKSSLPVPPKNVNYLGYLNQQELITVLSSATYYLQLSIAEGFPNALCEAMLCECIPIGSNVAAIPYIIGPTGYILYNKDIEELNEILLSLNNNVGVKKGADARNRIKTFFPLFSRVKELPDAINSLF